MSFGWSTKQVTLPKLAQLWQSQKRSKLRIVKWNMNKIRPRSVKSAPKAGEKQDQLMIYGKAQDFVEDFKMVCWHKKTTGTNVFA